MKILRRTTLIIACISAIYIISSYLLIPTPYSFRMWVDASGKLLTIILLPLLLILWGGISLWKSVEGKKVIKVFLGVIVLGAYLQWAFMGFLWMMFSVKEEHSLARNLLIVNEGAPLDEVHYAYYYPVAGILRTPGEFTLERKAEYLEEKYDRVFVVKEDGKVYDAEDEGHFINVYRSGTELKDNYVEIVWKRYFEEAYRTMGISRAYDVNYDENGEIGWIYLELKEEADIEALAEDASALIQSVMDGTDFFENHRAILGFYQGEDEEKITGFLPFGKLSMWDMVQEDYYKDPWKVAERIREEYEEAQEDLIGKKDYAKDFEGKEEQVPVIPLVVISPEEMGAQLIYDTILQKQGYSYELKYNAKGNLYIDLGSSEKEEEGQELDYYTLVYDRTSKNGKCELFVLYRNHCVKDERGNTTPENTVIIDIYAVEMETEKVIASGRKAWSDVGSKEYREATGE